MKTKLTLIIILVVTVIAANAQQAGIKMPSMIHVEGGTFMMGNNSGNPDEQPAHQVTLDDFYIGKYEITNNDFKQFVEATGYITDAEQPDSVRLKKNLPPRNINNGNWKTGTSGMMIPLSDSMKPVANISWFDAMAYCDWLSKATGKKFRLPTEAEWEFAARGGVKSKGYTYSGGNNLGEVAWYVDNSGAISHTIGQKMANELDCYDMSGNSREWCSDWYGDTYYKTSPELNPTGPEMGKNRVLRGGSWGSLADRMRVTYRNYDLPYNSASDFGFRLAMNGDGPKKAAPQTQANPFNDLDTKGFIDIYGIYFDIGKAIVKPESFPVIDQLAQYLNEHPKMNIVIEGHTDNTGKAENNLILSDKRAESVKAELVKRGIAADRMQTKGFGATQPIADNKTAAGRTQNRRVTIKKL